MTFSDPGVVKLMNEQFVCAWINKTPQTKFRDGMYAKTKMPMGLPLGTGVNNVTAVFAAADGTVVHAMPGYLDVAAFKHHLEFAQALYARLYDPKTRREHRAGDYADAHRKAAKEERGQLEKEVHALLAARFMRVDEMSLKFFDRLARDRG